MVEADTGRHLEFETPRARARLIGADDLDLFLTLYTDPLVMKHVGGTVSPERAAAIFAGAVRRNADPSIPARYWHVFDRGTGLSLGMAALARRLPGTRSADIGLMLVPAAQGSGLGVEVLSFIIDETLSGSWTLGVSEITGMQYSANEVSYRLMKRLGFDECEAGKPGWIAWRMTAETRAAFRRAP